MNVVFIGYRATGKTSVGRRVAARLGLPFHDTDEEVSRSAGKSIRELVEEGGWDLFREKEKATIAGLSKREGCVLSLGGGAILDQGNRRLLREKGVFVWLRADAATIAERMRRDEKTGDARPPLSSLGTGEEVSAMLRQREEAYQGIAEIIVETAGRTIEEVAEEVFEVLQKGNRLPSSPSQKSSLPHFRKGGKQAAC